MIIEQLAIEGVFELTQEPVEDERGFFARLYDRDELGRSGMELEIVQASVSTNNRRGTLRGLHLQKAPYEEAKLVRCLAGSVYDVVADLRPSSATYLGWLAVELSAKQRNAVFVPRGCAHGFLTLEDGCELEYLISARYEPTAALGVRWNDPALGIEWPFEPSVISERDAGFPEL